MQQFHLAQVNVGKILAPLEDPIMDGFRTRLDPINALADRSPGFVWRLQTEEGNAMDVRAFDDDLMAINLSVWADLDALKQFVYRTEHVELLRARKQWFLPSDGPILALWWVRAGHIPNVEEALERLDHLRDHGPTPHAFSFRSPFPAPDGRRSDVTELDAAYCEWAS